jgi:hypothetical protein
MNTYDLEKIARGLLKKHEEPFTAMANLASVAEKHDLTGDQIYTLCDMILDIACGVPI